MPKKQIGKANIEVKKIEKLLSQQTSVILLAVDEKLSITELNILSEVDKKLVKMESRINQKIDKLITTLDKFLKRLTDIEDEMEIIKLDINRLKKVVREKLGVDLQ
jgi:hypothetical protein